MRASNLVGLSFFLVAGSVASADIYLSGVVWYGANSSGSTITEPAEFDNIIGTNNAEAVINNTPRGTTHLLVDGTNDFSWIGTGFNALSLYFSETADPFSRPFGSAPDLVVYGTNTPLTPVIGALVQTNGQFSSTAAYLGNSSFTIGDRIITVTQLNVSLVSTGNFQITVVPAPAAFGLLASAGLLAARRRR
jgi:hypothetical protein